MPVFGDRSPEPFTNIALVPNGRKAAAVLKQCAYPTDLPGFAAFADRTNLLGHFQLAAKFAQIELAELVVLTFLVRWAGSF